MNILGIGGVLSEPAAAIVVNGSIAAAAEESKLKRRAVSGQLPDSAIHTCLRIAGITADDVDVVALARPLPAGSALPLALRQFADAKVVSVDHHAAHAAAAYFGSPYDHATVLTIDREGDLRCAARWRAEGNRLTIEEEILYPNSAGELYGRVTELLGYRPRSDEHLVQWLSATGTAKYLDIFESILQDRGVDQSWFDTGRQGHGGFGAKFFEAAGLDPRVELRPQERADIAASIQRALENWVITLAGMDNGNLCLGGGVAWNALLINALERSGRYDGVFAQPAAGNAGTAIGAALQVWHDMPEANRASNSSYCLGPEFSMAEIKQVLENCKLSFRILATHSGLLDAAVDQLRENRIVAWMQGRMEFGPRALGCRSILASPHDPYSTENLNIFIKHRQEFRKFAASVPAEMASQYFDAGTNARHLATVSRVKPEYREQFRSAILADDLIRVHTVEKDDNPLYWELLHAFGQRTGLPVLYNTSFNLFGEPLVCTPRDAVRSFFASGIDAMVVGNFLLVK